MKTQTVGGAVAKQASPIARPISFVALVQTPAFWTMVNIFLMAAGVFGALMANSVLLAREETDQLLQRRLTIVVMTFASFLIFNVFLNFFFGRFDAENRTQRHWVLAAALILGAALVVHNVFWYLGLRYDPASFPQPNSLSFTLVGFVMCFFLAIAGWYQLKFAARLYI